MPAAKNRVHLTDRLLQSLRSADARKQFMDQAVPNFGVRLGIDGRRVFFVRYRFGRQSRRHALGLYPNVSLKEARDLARDILVRAGRGEDPQQERRAARSAPTFAELAGEYVERYARREKRRWQEDVRILEKDLLPAWRHLPARSITPREVHRVLDGILDRGSPVMANRTRALISRLFNFGIEREVVAHNPVVGVRPPAREHSRQVVLSEAQLRTLWAVWDAERSITAAVFQLLLVTAQREREVLTMRWEDVDGPWWRIPPNVVKNKLAHRVYLPPLALAILDDLRAITGRGAWVFASPKKVARPVVAINKAAERFRATSGVDGWTPHDLRRTAATHMGRMGVNRLVIGKVLNHSEPGVTAIYDRSTYEPEMQDALCRWAAELQSLVGAGPASARPRVQAAQSAAG
jgi:integrase